MIIKCQHILFLNHFEEQINKEIVKFINFVHFLIKS